MKLLISLAIILLLYSGGWAQVNKNGIDQKMNILENRVNTLENQQKLFDAAVEINKKTKEVEFEARINEIKKENRVVEVIAGILAIIGIVAIASAIYQLFWGFQKVINEKITEFQKKFTQEIENIDHKNKLALHETIRLSSIEIELKGRYHLKILYNGTTDKNGEELKEILKSFHFKCNLIKENEVSTLQKTDIIIFFDDTTDQINSTLKTSKWLNELLIRPEITNSKQQCGFFFINKKGLLHNFKDNEIECYSSANSFATLYENLMSLLHYKRYLDKKTIALL